MSEVLVRITKRWRTRWFKSIGEWQIEPGLDEVTMNRGSREGFWLLTFITPDHKRGRHE